MEEADSIFLQKETFKNPCGCARWISYLLHNRMPHLGLGENTVVACSTRAVGVVWPMLLKVAASATYSNTSHRHVNFGSWPINVSPLSTATVRTELFGLCLCASLLAFVITASRSTVIRDFFNKDVEGCLHIFSLSSSPSLFHPRNKHFECFHAAENILVFVTDN